MQYDNKYDLDHNDCPEYETETPEEFASDFVVETEDYDAPEFGETPDEFVGSEFENEQAATTDDKPIGYDTDNIDTEAASDYYDIDGVTSDEREAEKYCVDPSDETAATVNEWTGECHSSDCGGSAREKCELDDYEIISDVLGSEKQIVKLYSSALCEAAEENFRDVIRSNFNDAASDQYKAFTFMQERGLYQTEQASENDISEAKKQFTPLCDSACGCGCNNDR